MTTSHDRKSGSLAAASEPAPAEARGFDPLSDVLRTVRLQAALFFRVDATSPWCIDVPHVRDFAGIILPAARHVVSYHVVVEGQGLATLPGTEAVPFGPGDILVIAHGDPYHMASAPGVEPEFGPDEIRQFFRELAGKTAPFVVTEGGGQRPHARFLCGFLGCDLSPFNPLFAALPRLLLVRRPVRPGPDILDRLIDLAMAEMRRQRFGGESIRLGLCELMLVEVLRRHLETITADRPSWLAGLRDASIGRALALLHAEPGRDWTLETLARDTGLSRSVLAERFAHCVGETPMHYLTLWRMQIAARMLSDSKLKVAAIGEKVGFRSEAAFSRAFKKATGKSPAEWRSGKPGGAGAAT